ncbi:50S ribosomal protein L28 [Candidatus Peregrinibacteria bacterium CG_4_9_14_0_2_um_filter_53_11]|nr:MAG: 50S ribosomal protein L28 [Candidatus Peregrinibacteria bacterium CG_4_9_14_0_2_um_filter_53_11]
MAKRCDKCDKRPSTGHKVSHSNIKTLRRFVPNLVRKLLPNTKGELVWTKICTACMRTMVKPPRNRAVRSKETTAPKAAA